MTIPREVGGHHRRSQGLRGRKNLRELCLASRQQSAGGRATGRLRSVLGRHPARRYPRDQPSERPLSQRRSGDNQYQPAADDHIRQQTGGSPHLVRSLVQMDAPDHPKYRALTQAWFMPRNIAGLDQRIRNIARASVERMAAKGSECDFVREVALHYPLHVVMEILGVPEEDEPRM